MAVKPPYQSQLTRSRKAKDSFPLRTSVAIPSRGQPAGLEAAEQTNPPDIAQGGGRRIVLGEDAEIDQPVDVVDIDARALGQLVARERPHRYRLASS